MKDSCLEKKQMGWIIFALTCVVGFLSLISVWFGDLNQDEGWYLYSAQMVHAGFRPYRDFFFTQGPALPYIYSVLSPVWAPSSPLHGLLGGRLVTLALGLLSLVMASLLVRQLVTPARRTLAGIVVWALLACNVYHLYFNTIPKTYALGGLFVLTGFALLARALASSSSLARTTQLFACGFSLALATGTRISLVLILPVVGLMLLFHFRTYRWSFVWFGLGGLAGLFLTYGLLMCDAPSLQGLLAAQSYHASRGGFDLLFVLGSISRLARAYASLGVVLFLTGVLFWTRRASSDSTSLALTPAARFVLWSLFLSFLAVFFLQLSAPYPYDDYQVPVMGLLCVCIGALFAQFWSFAPVYGSGLVLLTSCLLSFSSPLLQDWFTYGQDRFWSQKKEMSDLSKLRHVAHEINARDQSSTLLTQDLYLAVETGRTVPRGLEMGPFSYFPEMPTAQAKALHVLNRPLMNELLSSAPCSLAAMSGYAFAIAAPACKETPFEEQEHFFRLLKKNYTLCDREPKFGQRATTLLILQRQSKKGAQP